jgi:hypothetical protein
MILKIFSPMFSNFFCGTQKVQDYCFSSQKSCMLFTNLCGEGGKVRVWGSSAEDVTGRRYRGLFVF